jgi:hypothetical protein
MTRASWAFGRGFGFLVYFFMVEFRDLSIAASEIAYDYNDA